MAKKCDIEIKDSDGVIGQAFSVARELDGFILYKNTHPLNLTEQQKAELLLVNRAKDLKGIGVYTDSGILISYEKSYFVMKDYILDYSMKDDFMGMFRILYGDDEEGIARFKKFQDDMRDKVDKFFHIIEHSKTKETTQEYFFRLIRLVRDDEYNDIKLFLALFPSHRDAIKFEGAFKALFGEDLLNPEDYLRVRNTLAKKAGIYEVMPEFRIGKSNKGQSLTSHTYYYEMPEIMKQYYFEKKFYLPDGLEITDLSKEGSPQKLGAGNYVYVTNEDFLKFSKEDQKKLFIAIFEDYKSASPENAKELEDSIMRSVKNFSILHAGWTFLSGAENFHKSITNPILYAGMMSIYGFGTGYVTLFALNSFLHLPRYIAIEAKRLLGKIKYNGDFGNFCEQLGIFKGDIKFWKIIKDGFKEGEIKNSLLYILLAVKRQAVKLAEAQFFNIADTAMTACYRRSLVEEYLSIKYPDISSFDEYASLLSLMGKEKREKEIEKLVKYVDDKMYTRYNNSLDSKRYTKSSPIVPQEINKFGMKIKLGKNTRDVAQEIVNLGSSMWNFYRRYMQSYSDSVMGTIKEGRRGHSQKQVKELFEQFYDGKKTREEVSEEIDNAFGNNLDFEYLINTILYSALMSNMILKYDIHGNGYDEEYVDSSVLIHEYKDLFELFFFPIEAWKRTTLGMLLTSTFDAVSLDVGLEDNAKLIALYDYKTVAKQLFKSQWFLRGLTKLFTDLAYNSEYEWGDLSTTESIERGWKDLTSSIHGFGYYLKDDIERNGFEEYTPKTQSAWLKEIFGTREYSVDMYDDINKKESILKIKDREDLFTNYLVYNTPFLSEWKIGQFSSTEGVRKALEELNNSQLYHTVMDGYLPENVTDDEYYIFYNMMTKYNPRSLDQINLNFLVNWSREDDEGNIIHDNNKEAVEQIWHDLMIDNVDKNLLKEAVRLFTTADKSYQGQALSALLYLEADTPGAGQKLLGYLANYELIQNVYFSGKYGYFKKQEDGTYSLEDDIRRQEAMRQESINIAKKYFNYEFILDKEIRAQGALKLFKDSGLTISDYIKDTNENGTSKLGIYSEPISVLEEKLKNKDIENMWTSTEWYETFLLQSYAVMAAAEGNPDGFKMNNFASKLISSSGKKGEDGKLDKNGAKALLYAFNSTLELLDDLGISDVEKTVMTAGLLTQSDQVLKAVMDGMTEKEINNDPSIQYTLRFLWGNMKEINKLSDRAISETVQKEQLGTDPSDVSLSRVTDSKGWKKNKNGYSNWKNYYNKYNPLYDHIKYMTSKNRNYYNYLYSPKKTNASRYYSERERDIKAIGPGLASIKGSGGSRRGSDKQQQPGGSLTQRRGKARPFTNRGDLDKIPDRKTKPKNRRTRAYAVGSKLRNKLIPGRRRYIKIREGSIPTVS